jgi:hypothetical protein
MGVIDGLQRPVTPAHTGWGMDPFANLALQKPIVLLLISAACCDEARVDLYS